MDDRLGHWAASWWGLPRRVWSAVRAEADRDAVASGPLDLLLWGGGTPGVGIVAALLAALAVVPWAAIGLVLSVTDVVTRPLRKRIHRDVV